MSRIAYPAILAVALGSVLFGLDWQPATMSPMPDRKVALPNAAPAAALRSQSDRSSTALSPVYPASPAPPAPATTRQIIGTERARPATPLAQAPASEVAPPDCNVTACAAAYRSFLAADCSYQPFSGPRRRCTKR